MVDGESCCLVGVGDRDEVVREARVSDSQLYLGIAHELDDEFANV